MDKKIEKILSTALNNIIKSKNLKFKESKNLNIIKNFDSLDIVTLIIETEQLLENEFDNHIPLSNNDTFDVKKSPLNKWSNWIKFVKKKYN